MAKACSSIRESLSVSSKRLVLLLRTFVIPAFFCCAALLSPPQKAWAIDPLPDFTAFELFNEKGGKESHVYPVTDYRTTRSAMAYIEFIGNGLKLAGVSALFTFSSAVQGEFNTGSASDYSWKLRVEPINPGQAGTWLASHLWGSPGPGALDLTFTNASHVEPHAGTFHQANWAKLTFDTSASNYTLASGQRYRLTVIPFSPGEKALYLPSISFASDGGVGTMYSYYHSLFEEIGPNTLYNLNMVENNWAISVNRLPCEDSDGGLNYFTRGTMSDTTGKEGADACRPMDGNTLGEYYCQDGSGRYEILSCASLGNYICDAGACIAPICNANGICEWLENETCVSDCGIDPEIISCSDSDASPAWSDGVDPYTSGTVTITRQGQSPMDYPDYCSGSEYLMEYYCTGNNRTGLLKIPCADMQGVCVGGACVVQP